MDKHTLVSCLEISIFLPWPSSSPRKKSVAEGGSSCNMVCFNKDDSKSKRPTRSNQQAIAKMNRRVKLCQQFMALAAIVPGIEERDETSVIEKSIKYVKQLQDRVKTLGGQNQESCPSDENEKLPQIEARVSDSNVLIRIHCQLSKGALIKVLEETEKLHLNIVNSSTIQFGPSILAITIMAQMDDEIIMTVDDMVKSLRSSLIQFTAKSLPQVQAN